MDEDLITGLKSKDDQAFQQVMHKYKNKVYNYLKVLVSNSEIAEELTQDTFVKVYFKAHTLRTSNLKAWIFTIATNLARSEFRKKRVKVMFSLSDVNEAHISYNPSIEEEILVNQLISGLPEKYRAPLIMKEINKFSFPEISSIMKKPVGTIKTLVYRGKNQLKNNLLEVTGGKK